ncbi:endolytic transglycosylase MltG [Streptomyces sp. C10-9-1]|uniref:endolytic transglycosylase MltG n=1 Tax=Streptomyces sp. C10-9-1 TaxID=1859285 RepID=UPI0021121946|nr:endolytic transglycosylase MltG [Streptomyces sp. C10-9-1]MCQ6556506.1 endolytic transglycosylase MltG [Streptomyces sp. C10-9-1]
MTEYGRGAGPEPWHPEDPLYGDQGWEGQSAPGHAPYGDGARQYAAQGQDQYPYAYDPQHGGQSAYAQQPPGTYPQQYGTQGGQQQYPQQYQGQYGTQGGQDPYPQQYGTQGGQDPYPQQYGTQGGQQQYQDRYGTQGGQQYGAPGQAQDPSWGAGPEAAPYGTDQAGAYGGQPQGYGSRQEADYYATPEAYPPPRPPGRRDGPAPDPEPGPASDWDAEQDRQEEDHPFFTGQDAPPRRRGGGGRGPDGDPDGPDDRDDRDGEEPDEDGPEEHRGGRGKGKRKSRNGLACLVVVLVLGGVFGGAGYFGYQFWQDRGKVEDFAGAGTGQVEVEIPKGATGAQIGNILKTAGVVKSVDAFVRAQGDNPRGTTIQDGSYLLKKEMSGKAAVDLMLSDASRNNLVIPEGRRNAQIYAEIDKRLGLEEGTTEDVARKKAGSLGLPEWATGHEDVKDPLEGFLFPAAYPVSKDAEPEAVLRKMVARANQEFEKADLQAQAEGLGLENAWELLTVASLVQAEGKTHDDFRKMSEVVYNRLKPTNTETNQLLQFDSAFNYLKGQSEIDISEKEINSNRDPYNTYTQKGLTPGPIGNPGNEAIAAALDPTKDGWMYFVATDGMKVTEFAKTHDDFLKLKRKFNAS